MSNDVNSISDDERLARIIQLGFGGDQDRFVRFLQTLRDGLPPGTGIAFRGSAVTGERWEDGAPFDADGVGTSDLDITLVGDAVMGCWEREAFYIPGLHTKPLSDKDPDCARELNQLRLELQAIAGRPVAFQATNDLILFARDILMAQPYFTLVAREKNSAAETAEL